MKIIAGAVASGKSYNLMKLSHETGAYIVVRSICQADQVRWEAKRHGFNIPLPITYKEFTSGAYSKRISGFLIDDLEHFLGILSGVPIQAITCDNENIQVLGSVKNELLVNPEWIEKVLSSES